MARGGKGNKGGNGSSVNLGVEATLWAAADRMRGHMGAGEYEHVVPGLIFLKDISDAFHEVYEQLELLTADAGSDYSCREAKACNGIRGTAVCFRRFPEERRGAERRGGSVRVRIAGQH